MSEVNPFAQPPLVEWENCLTHDELEYMLERYVEALKLLKWYQILKKIRAKAMFMALLYVDEYIHQKALTGYKHETIN